MKYPVCGGILPDTGYSILHTGDFSEGIRKSRTQIRASRLYYNCPRDQIMKAAAVFAEDEKDVDDAVPRDHADQRIHDRADQYIRYEASIFSVGKHHDFDFADHLAERLPARGQIHQLNHGKDDEPEKQKTKGAERQRRSRFKRNAGFLRYFHRSQDGPERGHEENHGRDTAYEAINNSGMVTDTATGGLGGGGGGHMQAF